MKTAERARWATTGSATRALFAFPLVDKDGEKRVLDCAPGIAPSTRELSDEAPLLRAEVAALTRFVRTRIPESAADPVPLATDEPLPAGFDGRSFMLAYFLAAIACYRPTQEHTRKWSEFAPIWVTGEIEDSGSVFPVNDDDFAAKIDGFLSEACEARVFVVPSANWSRYESAHPLKEASWDVDVISVTAPDLKGQLHTGTFFAQRKVILHVAGSSERDLVALTDLFFRDAHFERIDELRVATQAWLTIAIGSRSVAVAAELTFYILLYTSAARAYRTLDIYSALPLGAFAWPAYSLGMAFGSSCLIAMLGTRLGQRRDRRFDVAMVLLGTRFIDARQTLGLRGLLAMVLAMLSVGAVATLTFTSHPKHYVIKALIVLLGALAAPACGFAISYSLDPRGPVAGASRRASVAYPLLRALMPLLATAPVAGLSLPLASPAYFPLLFGVALILASSPTPTARRLILQLGVRTIITVTVLAGAIGLAGIALLLPFSLQELDPATLFHLTGHHDWRPSVLLLVLGAALFTLRASAGRALGRCMDLITSLNRLSDYRVAEPAVPVSRRAQEVRPRNTRRSQQESLPDLRRHLGKRDALFPSK